MLDLRLLHRSGSLRVLDGLFASIAGGLGREAIAHESSELAGLGILARGEGFEGCLVPGGGRDDGGIGWGFGFGGGGGRYRFGVSVAGIRVVADGLDGSVGYYAGVGRDSHRTWAIASSRRDNAASVARERYGSRLGSLVVGVSGLRHGIANALERRIREHLGVEIRRKVGREEETAAAARRSVVQIRIGHGAAFDFRDVSPADQIDRLAPGAESTAFPSGETRLDRIDRGWRFVGSMLRVLDSFGPRGGG